jgi:GMP synthase (glutamine-hydrolysing)
VLGVCLGSQLLAKALGARVTKGKRKEIGWFPLNLTEGAMKDRLWTGVEPSFTAYHWHGDVFELPRGAEPLASSALTPYQAFRYGDRAYGFLFHMEVTEKIIAGMIRTFEGELQDESLDGRRITEMAAGYLPHLQSISKVVFGRWAGLVETA